MEPLDVGRLNKRIHLITFEPGKDRLGQDIRLPVESAPIWANVKVQRGSETYEAGKKQPETEYIVKLRFREGITTDMLIRYKGKTLEIESAIDVDEAGIVLELQCVEKQGAEL